MKEINTEEMKKIEFEMLVKFKEFCKKNNLRYYLCGGTLLGAIRHKGFIPWDDDIDVTMPRPDYNKLLEFARNSISDEIDIVTWKNSKAVFPFIKLVNNKTVVYENAIDRKKAGGVWVDIFPIDANPSDDAENRKFYRHIWVLRKILEMSNARYGSGTGLMKKVGRILLKPIGSIIGTKRMCEIVDKSAQKYDFDSSEYIGRVVWGYGTCQRVKKEPFLNAVKAEFEKEIFDIPSSYDECLTSIYGDYMVPVPEDMRVSLHQFEAYWKDN